jgi:fumarate hydratase class II
MSRTRVEQDSMGPMNVPVEALYGPQTARAVENFPISGWRMPPAFISALGQIKMAAAEALRDMGRLDPALAAAIIAAAREVAENQLDSHFPVDVFQTGSGTSSNMNANEVIARRAEQILGTNGQSTHRIHPNDHVNKGQSSNDVIPSAMHVAAAVQIHRTLLPALQGLREALSQKANQFDDVVKIGRTHWMDAVPVRLGQEFRGYARQLEAVSEMIESAGARIQELALGGTAVGTGLNCPTGFAQSVCENLSASLGMHFGEAKNHFSHQGAKDDVVFVSGALRTAACALAKIASDIRLMGSGPRCGLGELRLMPLQPGSSIMPGKVNPVLCETVLQVACQVTGFDAAITAGASPTTSVLELNVAMPMMAWNLLKAIELLSNSARTFADKCIRPLQANAELCRETVDKSLAMITALVPQIGYDAAADIAKQAFAEGKTIAEICREKDVLPKEDLDHLLDPTGQTGS